MTTTEMNDIYRYISSLSVSIYRPLVAKCQKKKLGINLFSLDFGLGIEIGGQIHMSQIFPNWTHLELIKVSTQD